MVGVSIAAVRRGGGQGRWVRPGLLLPPTDTGYALWQVR